MLHRQIVKEPDLANHHFLLLTWLIQAVFNILLKISQAKVIGRFIRYSRIQDIVKSPFPRDYCPGGFVSLIRIACRDLFIAVKFSHLQIPLIVAVTVEAYRCCAGL